MDLLLDTHVLLWALSDPSQLAPRVGAAIADPRNDVYVSAVNTWELVIKASLGRVDLPFAELSDVIEETGFTELPVTILHTLRVRDLPNHHRDPFDRLLVAQALAEEMTLVSADAVVQSYPVTVMWD